MFTAWLEAWKGVDVLKGEASCKSQNIAVETKKCIKQNWLLKSEWGVKDPLVCSMSLGNDALPIERSELQLPQPGRHTRWRLS